MYQIPETVIEKALRLNRETQKLISTIKGKRDLKTTTLPTVNESNKKERR